MNRRTTLFPLATYYSLLFMGGAGYTSYIGLYYAHINLSDAQIGLIAAISSVVGLISQPFWGSLADRAANKNQVLQIALFASGISTWLVPLAGNQFWLILAASSFFTFCGNSIHPMGDAIAWELAERGNFKFSTIRTVGSLGFALMAAVAGKIVTGSIYYIFGMFFFLRLAAFINTFFIPPVAGCGRQKQSAGFRTLLNDGRLAVLYAYTFVLSCTLGFFYSFHVIYSARLGIGADLIGIGIMVGSFSQFPFIIWFDWIYQKFGLVRIMLISGLVMVGRWLLYATSLTPATLVPFWLLHGLTFILHYLCLGRYIKDHAPPEVSTRGQVMNTIIQHGLSSIVGSFMGGLIAEAIGLQMAFGIAAGICGAAVAVFYGAVRFSPYFRENGVKVLPAGRSGA